MPVIIAMYNINFYFYFMNITKYYMLTRLTEKNDKIIHILHNLLYAVFLYCTFAHVDLLLLMFCLIFCLIRIPILAVSSWGALFYVRLGSFVHKRYFFTLD